MDERKNTIRELEAKKNSDSEERNRLLTGMGKTLIKRIGDSEPFTGDSSQILGAVLKEYRQLQNEITESSENIKSLETDILKLKILETKISEKETGYSCLKDKLEEMSIMLGRQLLPDPEFEDIAGSSKQQEEDLILKIEELEKKISNLGEEGGGFLAWLGKNAQTAVSKNLLGRNRSSLQRLYRSIGDKYLSLEQKKVPEGEAAKTFEKACEYKEQINSAEADLKSLREERKKITDAFSTEGSPTRRITGLEKHIARVKEEFPEVYLNLGTLAAESRGRDLSWTEALSPFLRDEDSEVLEKAESLNSGIAEKELQIKKINTSISIDKKKAEIEKLNKSIEGQERKITHAEEAITDYRKKITAFEQEVEELEEFLRQN